MEMCLGQGTARGLSHVGGSRTLQRSGLKMSLNRRGLFCRKTSPADASVSDFPFPLLRLSDSLTVHLPFQNRASQRVTIPPHLSPPGSQNHSRLGLQRGAQLLSPKQAGQSRGGPCYATLLSAGGCGDGLLELLAADLAGAGLQEQVVAGVADQHRVIKLLVWDGQLQVTTVFTEHVATVPEDGEHTES